MFKQNKLAKAEAAFHNALIADDSFGPAHNNIGLLHYEKGDLYSAAWSFERAMNSMPDRAEPVNNLGMTLDAAGRIHDAIEMYEAAWAMDSSNPEYLGNLVSAKLRRGDRDFSLFEELEELVFIETRPEWRVWAQQQLTMVTRATESEIDQLDAPAEVDSSTEPAGELLPTSPMPTPLEPPSNGDIQPM